MVDRYFCGGYRNAAGNFVMFSDWHELKEKNEKLEKENAELEKENEELRKQIEMMHADNALLGAECDKLKAEKESFVAKCEVVKGNAEVGCESCAHQDVPKVEEPCVSCKWVRASKYKAKAEAKPEPTPLEKAERFLGRFDGATVTQVAHGLREQRILETARVFRDEMKRLQGKGTPDEDGDGQGEA